MNEWKRCGHRALTGAISIMSLFAIIASSNAGNYEPPPHTKDAEVDPVSFGKVTGGVYDAITNRPIAGATVSIRTDGTFENRGKTVALTDEAGYYQCEAEIGRTIKRGDAAKIIGGIIGGVRLPGTYSQTNRLDVDQLTMRVSAPGYKPFTGIVYCRKRNVFSFEVAMDAVQLAPLAQNAASISVKDYGVARIIELILDPPVAFPDKEIQVTLKVACPPPAKNRDGKDHTFKAVVMYEDGKQKEIELKDRSVSDDGTYVFRGKFKAPKLPKNAVWDYFPVHGHVALPYTLAEGEGEKPNGSELACLQVIASDAFRSEAMERFEAYRLLVNRDYARAAEAFAALSKSVSARLSDDLMAGQMYAALGKATEAAEHYRVLFSKLKNAAILTVYTDALLASGQPNGVVDECEKAIAEVRTKAKESDLPRYFPFRVMQNLGLAYLKIGKVEKARETLERLEKGWEPSPLLSASVRLAEADNRLATAKEGGTLKERAYAQVERARALRDLQQGQDAVSAHEEALRLLPDEPVLQRDLVYCRLYLPDATFSEEELRKAIAAAESLTRTKEGPIKEFLPWHILGLLRCAKAVRLQQAGSPDVATAYDAAHEALDNALRYGRPTAEQNSPNAVATWMIIGGFINAAAAIDFDLRESLLILRKQPKDAVALTDLGAGFLNMAIPTLGDDILASAVANDPEAIQALYLRAVAAQMRGQTAEAIKRYQTVIERAPNHLPACRTLEKLVESRGDL